MYTLFNADTNQRIFYRTLCQIKCLNNFGTDPSAHRKNKGLHRGLVDKHKKYREKNNIIISRRYRGYLLNLGVRQKFISRDHRK